PVPYRVDYRLEAPEDYVTRELELTATTEAGQRRLLLTHDGAGGWNADGDIELPDLSEARDIHIENSPLTNTMPMRRHGLQHGGERDFVMAFVTLPDLRVEASPQRYEHVRKTDGGAVVRYLGLDSGFTAELELDDEGLLSFYPRLARRL